MYKNSDLKNLLEKYSSENINLEENKILVRVDLDVPLSDKGEIEDTSRIETFLPLLDKLRSIAKRVVIIGHLGRPEARESEFSLAPVKNHLEQVLHERVNFIENLDGDIKSQIDASAHDYTQDNRIYLLENVRFFKEENSKSERENLALAEKLATLGDVFINEAFASYRISPSTFHIAKKLPAYIGPNFKREVEALMRLENPAHPFVAVMGGAKLSEKIDVLEAIAEIADSVIIGGAMAYTLLKAQGISVGDSLVEEDKLPVAVEILAKYKEKLILPIDHITLQKFEKPLYPNQYSYVNSQQVPDHQVAVDIGPDSTSQALKKIYTAKTILWNGPMGVFEWNGADNGTRKIAEAIAIVPNAFKLTGGGDSVSAIHKFNVHGFDHISSGGGAMLSYMAYDSFPTLDVIFSQENAGQELVDNELAQIKINEQAPEVDMDKKNMLLVVYGTCSGNAELVADAITEGINKSEKVKAKSIRAELTSLGEVNEYGGVVLVSSTWNVGQIQDHMVPLYKEIVKSGETLKDKPMAVVGLGDSVNYDIFCGAADMLDAAVAKVAAKKIMPTLRVDGPPHARLNEYCEWGTKLADAYKS